MTASTDIINRIEDLFIRYGIKSVTMDDVARELGISKKTLYQYVDNKADLIHQVIENHACDERAVVSHVREEASDAIDEMMRIAKHVIDMFRKISPSVIYDLKKYYRDSYDLIFTLRKKFVSEVIQQNILEGKTQGLYRQDVDEKIIASIYVGTMSVVVDPDTRTASKEKFYSEFIVYHMLGIVNENGRKRLNHYLKRALNKSIPT